MASRTASVAFIAIYPGPRNGAAPSIPVLQHEQQLFTDYRIPATPFGVVVDDAGTVIAAEPLGSVSALESLVEVRSKEAA